MNPIFFTIGGFSIKWYSVLILISVIISYYMIIKEGERFSINKDFLFNLIFWTLIFGILGARIYYIIFNFSLYKNDLFDIIKIWEGGLAIHGGIIAGVITIFLYTKKYKVNTLRITDLVVVPLILSQGIGRWGNFFNGEAHGVATSLKQLQSLHIPNFIIEGMNINGIYYQPTFFYESLWCLLGFIIMLIIRRFKYIKRGQVTAFYLMWYSVGRFYIESLRTDSLMIGGFRMAQIVSVVMFLFGLGITMILSRKGRFEDLYNSKNETILF